MSKNIYERIRREHAEKEAAKKKVITLEERLQMERSKSDELAERLKRTGGH